MVLYKAMGESIERWNKFIYIETLLKRLLKGPLKMERKIQMGGELSFLTGDIWFWVPMTPFLCKN